ncbi:hypothetical protein GLOTRDRAFT_132917 [Gloeophyllum trabeum ATCC 11539]|uniref:Uncharacterized protein n=1 Tax=Gloeophyllum trabeum (strain ATCC 11539 / FP-39264 / Madison 617) TaxID=670483 RepID=S7PVA1_GLOTA|nr:uncharacterized protein GLOTRDRAFT_132917 [Gloeophyllum trabeum ATCC 11539]EPQ51551.1 hypothetical protein GLOTRDRAFT_132917 [Gloeophyllum trabeum ATCC 11539]
MLPHTTAHPPAGHEALLARCSARPTTAARSPPRRTTHPANTSSSPGRSRQARRKSVREGGYVAHFGGDGVAIADGGYPVCVPDGNAERVVREDVVEGCETPRAGCRTWRSTCRGTRTWSKRGRAKIWVTIESVLEVRRWGEDVLQDENFELTASETLMHCPPAPDAPKHAPTIFQPEKATRASSRNASASQSSSAAV